MVRITPGQMIGTSEIVQLIAKITVITTGSNIKKDLKCSQPESDRRRLSEETSLVFRNGHNSLSLDQNRFNAAFASPFRSGSVGPVADHNCKFGIESHRSLPHRREQPYWTAT